MIQCVSSTNVASGTAWIVIYLFCFYFWSPSPSRSWADQKVHIPAFDIQSLLPKDLRRYYRYNGSLTTPPCHQGVTWTLFHERVQISKAQVKKEKEKVLIFLRQPNLNLHPQLLKMETSLYSSRVTDVDQMLLQDNYRSTQPLNRRIVLASFSAGETGGERRKAEQTWRTGHAAALLWLQMSRSS